MMGGLNRSKTVMQDLLWRRSLFETRRRRGKHGQTSFRPDRYRIDNRDLVFAHGIIILCDLPFVRRQ